MPHNQLLQIRKQKNNNQSIIFYITPKAKHCKGAKILSFLYRIPDFGSLAKDEPCYLTPQDDPPGAAHRPTEQRWVWAGASTLSADSHFKMREPSRVILNCAHSLGRRRTGAIAYRDTTAHDILLMPLLNYGFWAGHSLDSQPNGLRGVNHGLYKNTV